MFKLKKVGAIAAGIIFVFSMAGCDMIEKTPEAVKATVVAKFNGGTVTKGEVDTAMKGILSAMKKQYGNDVETNSKYTTEIASQKSSMLTRLIGFKLEAIKAKELKVSSKIDIKKKAQEQIDKIKTQYGDSYKSTIAQQGYTEETLLTEMMVYEYVCKDVTATDKEIQTYYDSNKESYREKSTTAHLKHILVSTETEAKAAKTRITNGEDFEVVAKAMSTDTGTKEKGGDLGEVAYNDSNYDTNFMAAAMKLTDGQVSDPVQSNYGYHIIKCVKKTEYPLKKFETVKDDAKEKVIENNKSTLWTKDMKKWEDAAKIKKYESKL